MIELSKKQYGIIALILAIIAVMVLSKDTNHSRGPDEYGQYKLIYNGQGWFYPYPAQAYLKGDSCKNIRGSIFNGTKTPKKERLEYNGSFVCIPYVENISYHLKHVPLEKVNTSKIAKSSGNQIIFENGLLLIALAPEKESSTISLSKPDKIPDKSKYVIDIGKDTNNSFIEVTKSFNCTHDNDLFCIETRLYRTYDEKALSSNILLNEVEVYENKYYLFCWECKKLKKSIEVIQDSILFSQNNGDILILDGGYAISYLSSSNKYGVRELTDSQNVYYLNRFVKMRKLIENNKS